MMDNHTQQENALDERIETDTRSPTLLRVSRCWLASLVHRLQDDGGKLHIRTHGVNQGPRQSAIVKSVQEKGREIESEKNTKKDMVIMDFE
jgi:hypothetical protein